LIRVLKERAKQKTLIAFIYSFHQMPSPLPNQSPPATNTFWDKRIHCTLSLPECFTDFSHRLYGSSLSTCAEKSRVILLFFMAKLLFEKFLNKKD
jgi:hypothetical protein